jgi:hypothetical protein
VDCMVALDCGRGFNPSIQRETTTTVQKPFLH